MRKVRCTRYHCGMNGCNHQEEADRQPLWFCPEEEMKIWYAFADNPAGRYRRLTEFGETHGLEQEAAFWRHSEHALRKDGGILDKR